MVQLLPSNKTADPRNGPGSPAKWLALPSWAERHESGQPNLPYPRQCALVRGNGPLPETPGTATARARRLILVTGNVTDLARSDVRVLNPCSNGSPSRRWDRPPTGPGSHTSGSSPQCT